MEYFNKVRIETISGDINLRDGEYLMIVDAQCYVQDDCLIVQAGNDARITIPKGRYEEIHVHTISGDCELNINSSEIGMFVFHSVSGDLYVNTDMKNVAFSSEAGECFYESKVSRRRLIDRN